jgi:endonuclease YncB( thermonuclease family)
MIRKVSILAGLVACASAGIGQAACTLEPIGSGIVDAVTDGGDFGLADGRAVRLGGIEVTPKAKVALAERVSGRTVTLKRLGPDVDRYGRVVAQVFLATETGERWLQRELIEQGQARFAGRIGEPACAAELRQAEGAARAAGVGLWADPEYVMRKAEQPAQILADRGRFTVVEGRVLSVRESGGTIYVNFGRRWSEDFTVTILKRHERGFAAAGLEPKKLERRTVRVRGWIEERGGPWIEATRPEQIELAEGNERAKPQ